MKLLWLCNMAPGAVQAAMDGKKTSGLWVDHVLSDLRKEDLQLHILCPGNGQRGQLDDKCSFACFPKGDAHVYTPAQEPFFRKELEAFGPDVIHIWGSEYGHTLAMVRVCGEKGLLNHTVVSIQGLCSIYAPHYAEGVPERVQHRSTFRDFLQRDNIRNQQKKFILRGDMERQAMARVRHVIGRTDWDRACAELLSPEAEYHFCNETLREEFYRDGWSWDTCEKHRIFASSCVYPIKGFHYLLEAAAIVAREYPDVKIAVPGNSFLEAGSFRDRLRRSGYQSYMAKLCRQGGLTDKIEFLGKLSADGMKEQYLKANVFVLPSTIENSANSLGEAMLLGTPCVASDVGGVSTMLEHRREGFIYQSTAPNMLAHYILEVFREQDRAARMANNARLHAQKTHDPKSNLDTLLSIYRSLC